MFFKLNKVNKGFHGKQILKDISFAADRGEIISFIGPSGVGKTTLLKIIAGMETPDSGQIVFNSVDGGRNPAVMVFQDFLLFPNMTVFDNVAFGLRASKTDKKVIPKKVIEMLDCFQVREKADQYPKQLSAGQQQRVAIARAMVINPGVLLLDEPFANLDKNLKADTALFIRNTQKRFNTTTICVMHDQEEAFSMSDRIGIMLDGQLVQFDRVERVFHEPISIKAAAFLGHVNRLTPETTARLKIRGNRAGQDLDFSTGEYYFRAEAATITANRQGHWTIVQVVFFGTNISYHLQWASTLFQVHTLYNGFQLGDRVDLTIHRILRGKKP
jgi:putative spermidine/putrescine transport system ATP-binding protein